MAVALAGYLVAVVGIPLPASVGKYRGVPFPCQDHACGCATAEQCWAGDCCCFTLEEKVAWAAVNDVTPPEHVAGLLSRPRDKKPRHSGKGPSPGNSESCCDSPTAATTCEHCQKPAPAATNAKSAWIAGIVMQECRGHELGGVLDANPSVPPQPDEIWAFDCDPIGTISIREFLCSNVVRTPIEPPPRG